jgi:hypothetical protein
MTYDGVFYQPTFIYGLQDWGGNQDNPTWFAFRVDNGGGQTGPNSTNSYRVAKVEKETTGPNDGVFGAVTALYGGSCFLTGTEDCIPL